jgi:hypothetical protein
MSGRESRPSLAIYSSGRFAMPRCAHGRACGLRPVRDARRMIHTPSGRSGSYDGTGSGCFRADTLPSCVAGRVRPAPGSACETRGRISPRWPGDIRRSKATSDSGRGRVENHCHKCGTCDASPSVAGMLDKPRRSSGSRTISALPAAWGLSLESWHGNGGMLMFPCLIVRELVGVRVCR